MEMHATSIFGHPAAPGRVRAPRDRALAAAVGHLEAQTRSCGAQRSPCESRILESLLVLRLLEALRLAPASQDRLRSFLSAATAANPADPFASAARQVLGEADAGAAEASLRGMAGSFDHHTAARKRLYFGSVLTELGLVPIQPLDLAAFDIEGPHPSWTELILAALKTSHAAATGRLDQVPLRQLSLLRTRLAADGLFEHNVLCGVLGLFALARIDPAAARTRARRLLSHQRPDGGFPFFTVDIDVFATALAGLAIDRAAPLLPPGREEAARDTLHGMTAFVARQQRCDGGWAYARGIEQTDVDDTSYVSQLLARVDREGYRGRLAAARSYLLSMQGSDGGWPTYVRGQASEVAMTAGAMEALASIGPPDRETRRAVIAGARHLGRSQQPDGTFERSWSRAETNAMFRAVVALDAAVRVAIGTRAEATVRDLRARVRHRSFTYLAKTRRDGGGWGQRPGEPADAVSTAYGLLCLRSSGWPWIDEAMTALQGHQLGDGSFAAPSDQQGPRPLVWSTPQVSSAVGTLGLAHATALTCQAGSVAGGGLTHVA